MGYQALLFCPDEKLARIVAHVFGDLEFNVEPVQEPFSAVKKLMSQRYDALVVDCENESNASLLFKSARNSSSNQGTLAIAVVEGQAGVAKAYRIGANLVLTKPINVEQAKGTLRVARGLLRKNSEVVASASPVSPAMPAAQTPPPPAASVAPASAPTAAAAPAVPFRAAAVPPAPPKVVRELPEFEPTIPAMAASAVEAPVAAPVQDAPVVSAPSAEIPSPAVNPPAKEVLKPIATVSPAATAIIAAAQGAAVAPAKVKEVAPAVVKPAELQPDPVLEGADSEPVGSTPSFSALDLDKSGNAGGSKKVLIAAAVILAVAALGYFGWSKMGSQKASHVAPPAIVPQPTPVPASPAVVSAPNVPAPAPVDHSSVTNEPVTPKSAPSPEPPKSPTQAPVRPQVESEPEVKTTKFVAPIQVRPAPGNHAKKSSDDSNAPVPSPLAVAEANTSALSSLISAPTATARPTLATLKISQGVSQGLLIKRVDPKYPPSALAMHVQGAVLLDATISREGTISNVNVVKGDKILAHAAVEAVKQWRYKPYYLDGSPVEIQTQITINFKLPN